jgi:hypothetical protein
VEWRRVICPSTSPPTRPKRRRRKGQSHHTIGHNLLRAVSRVTTAPVTHAIYSHHHADHVGAMSLFDGAHRYAQREVVKLLRQTPGGNRPLPDVSFEQGLALHVGEDEIQLDYHGPNHSPGNINLCRRPPDPLRLLRRYRHASAVRHRGSRPRPPMPSACSTSIRYTARSTSRTQTRTPRSSPYVSTTATSALRRPLVGRSPHGGANALGSPSTPAPAEPITMKVTHQNVFRGNDHPRDGETRQRHSRGPYAAGRRGSERYGLG